MKRMYLFIFIGILAIIMIAVSFMNFDPKVETWSSVIAGACIALLIVKLPAIIAYFKSARKKTK